MKIEKEQSQNTENLESQSKELEPIKKITTLLQEKLQEFLGQDTNRYVKSVMSEIVKRKLTHCSSLSIFQSVKQAVDLGLEIDNRQHAHLIPRGNECTFMIGYRGFIYSIKKYIPSANIVANIVKEGDLFSIKKINDKEEFIHEVKDPFAGQDKIIGGYCYISYINEGKEISKIETLSIQEINKIKNVAKSKDIWNTWFEEKMKVAIIRRGCKILFSGLNNEIINNIIEIDNEEFDFEQQKPKKETNLSKLFIPAKAPVEPVEVSKKIDEPKVEPVKPVAKTDETPVEQVKKPDAETQKDIDYIKSFIAQNKVTSIQEVYNLILKNSAIKNKQLAEPKNLEKFKESLHKSVDNYNLLN